MSSYASRSTLVHCMLHWAETSPNAVYLTQPNADGSSYQNGNWTNVGTDGTVTQLSGAMTFGKNGEILSGTGIKYTSTDSSGKTVSGEFDYNNRELTHSKIRNERRKTW